MRTLTRRNLLAGAAVTFLGQALSGEARADATDGVAEFKFVVYKSGSKFRWRLKAANGETVATSGQGYATKQSCLNGIALVQQNAASATVE
jgi:uncharacterized protein YegP (UPF0339 family)